MNSIETTSPSLLPDPADEQSLKDLVMPFVEACPDMHDLAHVEAQGILDKYNIRNIDPDQVWWHRFDNISASSTQAFLFWEHVPTPCESLTLPQLVVQRFHAHDQDNADLLDSEGGFYNQDARASIYNETNEVRMYPSQVIKDLWRINFSERYQNKMNTFWSAHFDDYRILAKLNFISTALEEHGGSRLSNENLKTVLKAVAGNISWPVTLDMLKAQAPAVDGLQVTPLDIGGYQATDILRIVDRNGCQILYAPGELDAFHVFETPNDLHWWLLCQNNHADNRARFMTHFPLAAQQQSGDNVGLNHTIDLLYVTWGKSDHSLLNQHASPLNTDPFTWLRDSVKSRMSADAQVSLHSNGDLREQMWIGYLTAFIKTFGSMAVLGWPVALAAVGAGIANIGLNLDQAINGTTAADRKAGVIGTIVNSIDTLFNLLFLKGAAELAEVPQAREVFTPQENLAAETQTSTSTLARIEIAASGRSYVVDGKDLFAPFETNEILDGLEPVSEAGKFRNIYQPATGGNFILLNDAYWQVRYVNELKTWVIIEPANPFSFYRSLPVRLNAEGEWEPLTRPGLYGGGKIFDKLPWGRAPEPLRDFDSLPTPYDVPVALRQELEPMANGALDERAMNDHFVNIHRPDPALTAFKDLRRTLYQDAETFYANPSLPPRPEIPTFNPTTKAKDIIKRIARTSESLIVGENHASVGSKQFFIENMEVLGKQKFKTLYMEHLLTDFHQADLDIFNRGGDLSEDLENYLKKLDAGHSTDPSGQFTFLEVVKSAQKNHIRVQAIDCAASYRSKGILSAPADYRQKMMNYFAKSVIDADQAARGAHKWVALVGDSHANTWDGVAGLSELEGGIGLRIESAEIGQAAGIEPDPGRMGTNEAGMPQPPVRSDLRLQLEVPATLAREQALALALKEPGMLTLEPSGSRILLIHRSSDGSLVRTPIVQDSKGVYITRPSWSISNKHFANLTELGNALDRMGMKRIRVP